MTSTEVAGASPAGRTPWHLWVVGSLSLPWNAFGCWDYWMTNTKGAAHLKEFGFTPAQIEYFLAMPAWMTAVWALGVWPSLLGSVLLLLRSKHAYPTFVGSTAFFALSLVYQWVLSPGLKVMGFHPISVVIAAALAFFIWYARAMTKTGVLR